MEKQERWLLAWSFAYFFCLLSSYYVLRPVRDEMGIQAGAKYAVAVYRHLHRHVGSGTIVRLGRHTVPETTHASLGVLVLHRHPIGFFTLLRSGAAQTMVAAAFFIWVSVFNLFVVSVFWSFMADIFDHQQAKRLFGIIAAGGSTGAIAGPALTAALAPARPGKLAPRIGVFLLLAIVCVHRPVAHAAFIFTPTMSNRLPAAFWRVFRRSSVRRS